MKSELIDWWVNTRIKAELLTRDIARGANEHWTKPSQMEDHLQQELEAYHQRCGQWNHAQNKQQVTMHKSVTENVVDFRLRLSLAF